MKDEPKPQPHPKSVQSIKDIPVKNTNLLKQSLTHRSWINEHPQVKAESNERLEFLGDAVLELIVSEFLFKDYPDYHEGVLTIFRASLVRTETLAKVARSLNLGDHMILSHGEELSGGRDNSSLLANCFEAVIGAIYLDQGLIKAQTFVQNNLLGELKEIIAQNLDKDPKSHLQEQVQALGLPAPRYEVEKSKGPDHDKVFTVSVLVNGKKIASGEGKSKQQAQQQAAAAALEKYQSE